MSVDVLNPQGTTYLLDSSDQTISVPAGVYEAASSGEMVLTDSTGQSFFTTTTKSEICAVNGISGISSFGSVAPTRWLDATLDTNSRTLGFVSIIKDNVGLKGITASGAYSQSTDGINWTFGGSYSPTLTAPTVIWSTTADAQAIPGVNVVFPTTPALQQGDIVLVTVGSDAATPNLPAGWTNIENNQSGAEFGRTFYQIMGASPLSSVYIDGLSEASAVIVIAIRGARIINGVPVFTSNVTNNSVSNPNPPSITTIENQALVIAYAREDDVSDVTGLTAPTGYSGLVTAQAAGLTGQTVMLATRVVATAGTEDPSTFTTPAVDEWTAGTIAFYPRQVSTVSIAFATYLNGIYLATTTAGQVLTSSNLSTWSFGNQTSTFASQAPASYLGFSDRTEQSSTFNLSLPSYLRTGDTILLVVQRTNDSDFGYSSPQFSGLNSEISVQGAGDLWIGHRTASASDISNGVVSVSWSNTNFSRKIYAIYLRNADFSAINTTYLMNTTGGGAASGSISSPSVGNAAFANGFALYFLAGRQSNSSTISSSPSDSRLVFRDGGTSATSWWNNQFMGAWRDNLNSSGQSTFNASIGGSSTDFWGAGSVTISAPAFLTSIAFGNGRYIAAGNGLWTSTDGVNWTRPATVTAGAAINKVTFDGTYFWLLTSSGVAYYSTNGTSWTAATVGSTSLTDISLSGNSRIISNAAGELYTSTGVASWTLISAAAVTTTSTAVATPEILWRVSSNTTNSTESPNSIEFRATRPGDTVYVFVNAEATSSNSMPNMPEVLSPGWEAVAVSNQFTNGNLTQGIFIFKKVMGAVPDSGFVVSGNYYLTSSTTFVTVRIRGLAAVGIRGVDHTQPITKNTDSIYTAATSGFNANNFTPATTNSVAIMFAGSRSGTMTFSTMVGGFTSSVSASTQSYMIVGTSFISGTGQQSGPWMNFSNSAQGIIGVFTVPLTGPIGTTVTNTAVNSILTYRAPITTAMGAGTNITTVTAPEAGSTTIGTNLSSNDRAVQITNIGTRLVALFSNNKIEYSGTPTETTTLKLTGQAVRA